MRVPAAVGRALRVSAATAAGPKLLAAPATLATAAPALPAAVVRSVPRIRAEAVLLAAVRVTGRALAVALAVPGAVDRAPAVVTRAMLVRWRSARSKLPLPVTLAVDTDARLARLDGLEPDTVALDRAARLERSELDVTLGFCGATIQPSVKVATVTLKPVPAPMVPACAVRVSPTA